MPLLAAVVVVSLGAGIGVNTVVFSWIQTRLLKPLAGVSGAAEFHWVESRTDTGVHLGVSWLEYDDLRARLHAFRDLLAFRSVPLYLGEAGQVERAYGLLVSDNYFSALGLQPEIGRFPASTDDPAIVISYGLWRTRFGSDPGVLGQTLRVNGSRFAIAGVAPREFQGTTVGLNFDVWLPAALAPELLRGSRELVDRTIRGYSVMGKLQGGVTLAQAQADLDGVMRQLAGAYPQTNATLRGEVLPFLGPPRGPMRLMMAGLAVLQGIMLLLLLAVCGNTANLVLARASARQREMGVRLALGAGPWRIACLLLTENVLLAARRRGPRRDHRHVGHTGAGHDSALRAADQISDERGRRRPRVRDGAGGRVRSRRRSVPGRSAGARRSAGRASRRSAGPRAAAACGTRS